MKFFKIIFLLFSIIGQSQTIVKLRDVNFKSPSNFTHFDKENIKMNYDLFYENGKIYIDSTDTVQFPKIAYQYYEIPSSTEDSKIVLKRLNEIMTKNFKPDSLMIDGENDLSIAKYQIMGITLFEIKSLGNDGWINIAFTDLPENDIKNIKKVKEIAYSIHHKRIYNAEYKERMKESGNSSKFFIIAFCFMLFITGIRKLMNKNVAQQP